MPPPSERASSPVTTSHRARALSLSFGLLTYLNLPDVVDWNVWVEPEESLSRGMTWEWHSMNWKGRWNILKEFLKMIGHGWR